MTDQTRSTNSAGVPPPRDLTNAFSATLSSIV